MANEKVNKVVYDGTTLIDLTSDTVAANKLLSGYTAHDASGAQITGTYDGGSTGGITQDSNGYLVLDDEGGGSPTPTPTPTPSWTRPSDWPDLSQMDVSGGDILYMTSYADEARGFCKFTVTCTGKYTVEVGSISGTTFTAESSQDYASNVSCPLYYGSVNGTYKVLRVTGTAITKLSFNSSVVTIGNFNGYAANQGIIDIVGKLPSGTGLTCQNQYNLVNVEVSGLVLTSGMGNMFGNCYSLKSIDVSDWDTSSVTTMNSVFSNCISLTSLDVSKWDTSSATTMSSMFTGCRSLTSLDVSDWDTSSVTNMTTVFQNCASLASLDVSKWDTSSVTTMNSMFSNCYSLTSLDVSKWDTSSVTTMNGMFYYCVSLTSLDVSKWDTSSVTTMSNMFYNCDSLTSLDVSDWDTSSVTNMNGIFYYCFSLASLDVSKWDTSSATDMNSIFYYCASLTSLDVSDWDTSSATTMSSMFYYCYSLTSLDVSDWDTSSVTNMSNMFGYCISLTALDVSGWDFSGITTLSNTNNMFNYCHGLRGPLTLPTSMAFIGSGCFSNCRSLTEWHFLATTPPTLSSTNAFSDMTDFDGGKKIYVPQASLSAYQTATNWSTYASYMVGE